MSTSTYASPIQEFWHNFPIAAGGAGAFNVMELVPPAGSRIIIDALEGNGTTNNAFRIGVYTASQITSAVTQGVVLLHNPAGFANIARSGTRADVGLFGYLAVPAFRQMMNLKTVVDSIMDQRFVAIYQTANEVTAFSVHGYITASEFDTAGRLVL